jgi:membrane protease YdiL (CAAX protease family)
VALSLIVPVPSLGVIAAMVAAPGPIGRSVYLAAKIWLVVIPAAWYLMVEKQHPSLSPPRKGGIQAGLLSGIGIAVAITAAGCLAGSTIVDPSPLRASVRGMGLGEPARFLAAAAGWTLANSLMEEYVYRRFVFSQSERLFSTKGAILASAVVFTLHHIIAVSQYLDPLLAGLASVGVFIGGVIWARLYARYRSIWPGWISHVLADVAVFGVGWWLLFG